VIPALAIGRELPTNMGLRCALWERRVDRDELVPEAVSSWSCAVRAVKECEPNDAAADNG